MDLTSEQESLIAEFIDQAIKRRNNKGKMIAWRISEYTHQTLYDFNNGRDASKDLMVKYILHLKQTDPENPKIELLESVIPKSRFHTWILEKEYERLYGEIPLNKITYDGHGYYYLSTGFRIDSNDDLYKEERLKFNEKKQKFS